MSDSLVETLEVRLPAQMAVECASVTPRKAACDRA